MGYSPEVIDAATAVLEQRRSDAARKVAALRANVIAQRPRIREIEQEMASSSMQVTRAVLDGGDVDAAILKIQEKNMALQAELAAELAAAGAVGVVNFEPVYTCQRCNDSGYVYGKICECYTHLLRDEACRRISYPGMGAMRDAGFEELRLDYYPAESDASGVSPRDRMKVIFEYANQYAEDFDLTSPSLLLSGRTGTGKTHVSLAIAKKAATRGFDVIYGPAQNLFHRLEKEHFGKNSNGKFSTGSSADSMEVMTSCDLLIMDDLGAEFTGPFYISCLYNIINARMLDGLPTIISTNLDQSGFYERYGEQITSRVIGNYTPLLFLGRDIRQIKLTEKFQ